MKNFYYQNVRFGKSFHHAIDGLKSIFRDERNFRLDLFFTAVAVIVGLIFKISHSDWIAISLVISMVLISETINSVIEAICDTVSSEYKVNIKYAKDVSAGAVLVSATVSIITGLIVFLPYLIAFIKEIGDLF